MTEEGNNIDILVNEMINKLNINELIRSDSEDGSSNSAESYAWSV